MWWCHEAFNGAFNWGWLAYGGLMMALFWGGLLALAAVLLRGLRRAGRGSSTALEILSSRYAKGEISREEYQRMRKDLEG